MKTRFDASQRLLLSFPSFSDGCRKTSAKPSAGKPVARTKRGKRAQAKSRVFGFAPDWLRENHLLSSVKVCCTRFKPITKFKKRKTLKYTDNFFDSPKKKIALSPARDRTWSSCQWPIGF